jgi:hypothetical protein
MEMQIYKDEETKEEDDLLQLMKIQMSTEQEQIFMTSHYLYLQYGSDNTKFVVNFDEVWKNVDFSRRDAAKRLLEKHFVEHIDYKKLALPKRRASLEEKAAPHLGGAAFINENNGNLAYHLGKASLEKKAALLLGKAAPQLGKAAPQLGGASFDKNIHGGQNKETILLTVDCFKNFCMLAATPKAKEIRTYYIKMENIMHEYYKNFKFKNNELQTTLQLSQSSLQLSQSALQQSIKETAIKRHEVLIESNLNKWVVYFCRIQLREDGSFILKIGETIDIKSRMDALRCNFETNIILLDVFICENSIKFEKSLHNSNELVKYKYNQLEHKNKKLSTEAYHIPNQKEYEKILKFANNEMHKYNNIELTKLRIEEKKIDLFASKIKLIETLIPLCKNYDEIMSILHKLCDTSHKNELHIVSTHDNVKEECYDIPCLDNSPHKEEEDCKSICKEEEKEEDVTKEEEDKIIPASSTGPIVQIYHKSDLTKVVHVYNSIIEATRDFNYNNKSASFTAIKKAYQYKTIYQDYRWHFIFNRQEIDLQQSRNIGETMITQERNQGQIAMLNIDKTKIIKVFKLSKDAAKEILQHPSAMCSAIKHTSPLNNHYWMHWENVDVLLQDAFLQLNILPAKQENIRGIKIKQLHPITNEIVKLFVSYTDIQKELKISVKKIKELIESNEIYKGKYKFKLT